MSAGIVTNGAPKLAEIVIGTVTINGKGCVVTKKGNIYDLQGNKIGLLSKNGNIYDLQGNKIGLLRKKESVNRAPTPRQIQSSPIRVNQEVVNPTLLPSNEDKTVDEPPSKSKKKLIYLSASAVLALISLLMIFWISKVSSLKNEKGTGDFSSGGFSIDYEMKSGRGRSIMENRDLNLTIKVKGDIKEGERLALRLTSPSGKTEDLKTLDKSSMKDNYNDYTKKAVIDYRLRDPEVGKYFLDLKSFNTKKVVCRKEVKVFLNTVVVKDVGLHFVESQGHKYLDSIILSLEKDGNLPLELNGRQADITINDSHKVSLSFSSHDLYFPDEKAQVELKIYDGFFGSRSGQPIAKSGDLLKVRGRVPYLKGKKYVEFEKEVIVD